MNATTKPTRIAASAVMLAIDLAKDVFELAFADAGGQVNSCKRVGPRDDQADNNSGLRGRLNVWPRLADSMMARDIPTAKPNTRMQPPPPCRS